MDELFVQHIQKEQFHHKECRNKFVMQKLLFITALLGIGTIDVFGKGNNQSLHFPYLLYFVPFVAIAYDLYIFAEDFKVKRIGCFLNKNTPEKTLLTLERNGKNGLENTGSR